MAGATALLAELLASVPVVAEACLQDMQTLGELASCCVSEKLEEGKELVEEGRQVLGMYVLTGGQVALKSRQHGGSSELMKTIQAAQGSSPPRILCLWPALTGDPCRMSIAAMPGGASVVCIPRKSLIATVRRVRSLDKLVECVINGLKGDHGDKIVERVSVLLLVSSPDMNPRRSGRS